MAEIERNRGKKSSLSPLANKDMARPRKALERRLEFHFDTCDLAIAHILDATCHLMNRQR
jgi:hypothetical protein